jgi:hypothetical protein
MNFAIPSRASGRRQASGDANADGALCSPRRRFIAPGLERYSERIIAAALDGTAGWLFR